jgi:hypothetical protein
MNKRLIGACLAGAVSLTATGCAQRIDGHAIALDPPKPALVVNTAPVDFEPCLDISDSTLRSSGLNPSTETALDKGAPGCRWNSFGIRYSIEVNIYDFPIADADQSSFAIERRTTVGGRPALVYRPFEPIASECGVAFDGGSGAVTVYIWSENDPNFAGSCEVALQLAADIVNDVPA